ncbi:MAG: hypothetical protein FJX62_15050 [Alphaproteobacteria bacterium]|nr:hypothetical protein [Alphaproteobacteria bacterium]
MKDLIYVLSRSGTLFDALISDNYSTRSGAVRLYNMCRDLAAAAGESPILDAIIDASSHQKSITRDVEREAKNTVYRYISVDPRHLDRLKTPQLFTIDGFSRRMGLNFLALRILVYLQKRRGDTNAPTHGLRALVPIKEIVSFFGQFEIPPEKVRSAILDLAIPRGVNSYGLIFVDLDYDRLAELRGHSKLSEFHKLNIGIFPSGSFLLEKLLMQCEYVFWSAMLHPHFSTKLSGDLRGRGEFRERFHSETYRAKVSLEFLVKHILPVFEQEMNRIVAVSKERLVGFNPLIQYCRAFGIDNNSRFFIEQMFVSISAFASTSHEYASYHGEISMYKKMANEKFKNLRSNIFSTMSIISSERKD